MTKNKLEQAAIWLALGAGGLDFCTGVGLMTVPALMLRLMFVPVPGAEALVYLRWLGAFVMAVGASYLWALGRKDVVLLRHTLELTVIFRIAVGLFSTWALMSGLLPPMWTNVPVTDFGLAAAQIWLLRRGVFR